MNPWTPIALCDQTGVRILVPAFAVSLALQNGWQPARA